MSGFLKSWFGYSSKQKKKSHKNRGESALEQQVTIFMADTDPRHPKCTYRVPAIYQFEDYIFAFAEQRLDTSNDWGRMNIGLRRAPTNNPMQFSAYIPLPELPGGLRAMNPCPVACTTSGNLFVLVAGISPRVKEPQILQGECHEDFRIFVTQSGDFDDNWSDWKDITHGLKQGLPVNSKFFVVGPGHGVETEDEDLVVPGYFYRGVESFSSDKMDLPNARFAAPYNNVGCACTVVSEDQGKIWELAGALSSHIIGFRCYFIYSIQCSNITLKCFLRVKIAHFRSSTLFL